MGDKKSDLRDLYDALAVNPDDMTPEDVAEELEGAASEAAALRSSVAEMARSLGAELRKAGIAAPPVLKDVAETLTDTTILPREEKLARPRAANRFANLERRRPVPEAYELLEAARKGPGELSPEDRALLDNETDDFRKEIDAEHDKAK
ncbi:MAG: hypothetical protein QOC81_838 [Thermoanaerobaculia bacterium]|jgi:hypothetical protein|nr:hypothetical protein [Thermoanaerobaculia bacterium]